MATCARCGYAKTPERSRSCYNCSWPFDKPFEDPRAIPAATLNPAANPVIVRTYLGRTQGDAAQVFAREAPVFAQRGYAPVSQSWADGRPGVGRVLTLGLAANAMRPDGTLTVTFQFQGVPEATKVCPRCAETIKAAAAVCRYCGHEFGSEPPLAPES